MSLEHLSDVVLIADVQREFHFSSVWALQRRVRLGKFPPPMLTHPARWAKADLQRFIAGEWRPAGLRRVRRAS